MVSGKETTLLLGAVLPTAACLALLLVQWHSAGCRFAEHPAGSGLLTCTQHVRLLGDQRTALVRVRRKEGLLFRRREVDHWLLVDAGAANSRLPLGGYATALLRALQRALRPARRGEAPAQLDLVLLTSARATGALPALLQAYPNALVAAHADEAPYLVGNPPVPSANLTRRPLAVKFGLLPATQLGSGVPPDRFLPLLGEGGDVADAAAAAGGRLKQALSWLPRGTLSGAMLAGDAVAPARGWLGGIRGLAEGATPAAAATAAGARLQQRVAAKHLVGQPGYRWLLPSGGGNFSREQAGQLVQGWPDEVRQAGQPAAQVAEQAPPVEGGRAEPVDKEETTQAGGIADTAAVGLGLSPGVPPSTDAAGKLSSEGDGGVDRAAGEL
ncbi:hypothetical protein ABPG75_001913 [Micractinium tetrahymenae]